MAAQLTLRVESGPMFGIPRVIARRRATGAIDATLRRGDVTLVGERLRVGTVFAEQLIVGALAGAAVRKRHDVVGDRAGSGAALAVALFAGDHGREQVLPNLVVRRAVAALVPAGGRPCHAITCLKARDGSYEQAAQGRWNDDRRPLKAPR